MVELDGPPRILGRILLVGDADRRVLVDGDRHEGERELALLELRRTAVELAHLQAGVAPVQGEGDVRPERAVDAFDRLNVVLRPDHHVSEFER